MYIRMVCSNLFNGLLLVDLEVALLSHWQSVSANIGKGILVNQNID